MWSTIRQAGNKSVLPLLCRSSIENCIKMCFFSFHISVPRFAGDSTKQWMKIVLLLMSIDNLEWISSPETREVSKQAHTVCAACALNNGHFFPFPIDQFDAAWVQKRRTHSVQKKDFEDKEKQIIVKSFKFVTENYFLKQISSICLPETLMKLTLFCAFYCTKNGLQTHRMNAREWFASFLHVVMGFLSFYFFLFSQ